MLGAEDTLAAKVEASDMTQDKATGSGIVVARNAQKRGD